MGEAKTGIFQCSQAFGICQNPVPKLNLEQTLILELLKILRHQWNRVAGFSGERRTGIPFSAVKDAAGFIGVRLNRKRLNLLNECMTAIVNDDIQGLKEASK